MITRDNYEEFFLLYGDNELSAAQRRAVEEFVDNNPDLKEEWDLFLQCRITPDDQQVFANPEALLQHPLSPSASSPIHTDNYEEYLLSCIDGELDDATRLQVAAYIHLHPSLQKEWTLLGQTVNSPDPSIVFPDKASLYRKEERPTIIWLTWGRIAVAAAFIGIIALFIFNNRHNNNSTSGMPANSLANAGHISADKKTTAPVTHGTVDTLYFSNGSQNTPSISQDHNVAGTDRIIPDHTAPADQDPNKGDKTVQEQRFASLAPDHNKTPIPAGNRDLAKTESPGQDNTMGKYSEAGAGATVIDPIASQKPGNITASSISALTSAQEIKTDKNSSFATQALLAENTGDTEDGLPDDQTAAPKKNKLRGFFRKVSRVIEKRTSRDDDEKHEVLIGGFQIAQK